jgi:hypothetical protein
MRVVVKFLEAYPGMTVTRAIDAVPPSSPQIEHIAEGLRKAGLPE